MPFKYNDSRATKVASVTLKGNLCNLVITDRGPKRKRIRSVGKITLKEFANMDNETKAFAIGLSKLK